MQKIGTYWYMTIGKSGNPGGVKENVAATHFDFLQTCDLLTSHPAFMKSRSQRQSCKADRPAARMSGFTTAECLSGIDKIIMIFHKKMPTILYIYRPLSSILLPCRISMAKPAILKETSSKCLQPRSTYEYSS